MESSIIKRHFKFPFIFKGFEIRECACRQYIPEQHCPNLEIIDLNDCDATIEFAETIEDAIEIIKENNEQKQNQN